MVDYHNARRCCDVPESPQESVPLAMAYVRPQTWEEPRTAMEALKSGTAFPCLTKPFLPMEVRNGSRR